MAKKRNTAPQRLDAGFMDDINLVMRERHAKGLITKKQDLSFPAITGLMRRTNSWKGLLHELKTKPKREDLR